MIGDFGSRAQFCQLETSARTASVTRQTRSADTFRHEPPSRWARILRFDNPAAYRPLSAESCAIACRAIDDFAIHAVDPDLAFLDQLRFKTAIPVKGDINRQRSVIAVMLLQFVSMGQINPTLKIGHSQRLSASILFQTGRATLFCRCEMF